jgi:hypothetical protein
VEVRWKAAPRSCVERNECCANLKDGLFLAPPPPVRCTVTRSVPHHRKKNEAAQKASRASKLLPGVVEP